MLRNGLLFGIGFGIGFPVAQALLETACECIEKPLEKYAAKLWVDRLNEGTIDESQVPKFVWKVIKKYYEPVTIDSNTEESTYSTN